MPEHGFEKRSSEAFMDDESINSKEDERKKDEICCRPNLSKANCTRTHHKLPSEAEEEKTYTDQHQPMDVNVEIIDMIKEFQRTRPDLLE